ncbi:hypothetical protein PM082_004597 [Marasmius tenuissimus]|nr:hypothetical protein PM082_004597 [Marasmius tenuissimus]
MIPWYPGPASTVIHNANLHNINTLTQAGRWENAQYVAPRVVLVSTLINVTLSRKRLVPTIYTMCSCEYASIIQ